MSCASAVEAVLFAALERGTAAERNAYLDSACAGDAELRRQVERLLKAHANVGDFLQKPVIEQLAATPGSGDTPAHDEQATVDPIAGVPSERAAHAAPLAPEVGVPGYEILGELGRGGMGVVYKARHLRLKRLVALKMILHGDHARSDQKARFRAEAEAVARLHHPNIVQVYEIGEDQGRPFFSLEFIDGGSLDKKLAGTPLLARTAALLVEAMSRAVEAAHQGGIVHRDLKPANILLAGAADAPVERCTPKITDFGLAKQIDDNSAQTRTGTILGTPAYIAPEQAAGRIREIGPLSDVYSLGAILYECLTGRPPFKGATMMETLEQVRNAEPVPPRRLQPRVPRDLDTICLKCIEKQRHHRYTSAAALADDLQRFLNGEPIHARPVRFWERASKWMRRRPAQTALVGVLLAVALAVPIAGLQFAAQLAQQREAEQKRLNEARAEVHDLCSRGQTAARSQDWTQAEALLDKAVERVTAEPALANLHDVVEAVRAPVKARLAVLDAYKRFVRDRDEALFHATLATGENARTNRETALQKAYAALPVVGFSLAMRGKDAPTWDSSFTSAEKAEVTTGCYALLLMLAELEARAPHKRGEGKASEHLRQALTLLDRADSLGLRTRAIHLRRARYLTLLGDEAAAGAESEQARALARQTEHDPLDHFLVGTELYNQGKLELANLEFRRALQLDGRHFWTHYFLGICCVTSDKPEVALAHLTICQSQQPKVLWIYLLRGFALGQMENYQAAETDFDQALALQPSPATLYVLYNNRGVMRVGQKEMRSRGIEDLNQAAALRPDQYQALASLAEAYRLDNQLDEASTRLDAAIVAARRQVQIGEVTPATLALLHHSRARLHLQRHDRAAAVSDFAEAARLADKDGPLRARAEADRGRVLHLQERFEEALAAYDAALKANPAHVDVLRWRGEVLLVQSRYPEAAAAFDSYLQQEGEPSAAVYRQRGLARARIGNHAEAIDDYSRALESRPKDAEKAPLHLYRAQEYLAVSSLPLALRDFQEALRLDPTSADARLGCAHVRVKLNDVDQGVADADQVVAGEPKAPRLWHGAARVHALAVARLGTSPAEARTRTRYQARAVLLLGEALQRVPPADRQAYWRDNVMTDAVLYSLRSGLDGLAVRFGVATR